MIPEGKSSSRRSSNMESSTNEEGNLSRRIQRRVDLVVMIVPKAVDAIPPVDARKAEVPHVVEISIVDVLPVVSVNMEVEDVSPLRRTRRAHAEDDPNIADIFRMIKESLTRPSRFRSRNRTGTRHVMIVITKILRPEDMSLDISPAI